MKSPRIIPFELITPTKKINIAIIYAFVSLQGMLDSHQELGEKLDKLERQPRGHADQIQAIFSDIRQLMARPEPPRKRIAFMAKESRRTYRRKAVRREIWQF